MKNQAMNPFLPLYEYVPDGEPRVFGDRLYLYGSHDRASGDAFCMDDYVVWSAPTENLADWRYEGVSYRRTDDPLSEGANLQAPDCVQGPDGRYYLYYNAMRRTECGVAVSDTPQGPFTFLAHVHLPDGTVPPAMMFDPGVLVDDDGRVYLYTGFVPGRDFPYALKLYPYSVGYELAADMHTIISGPVDIAPGVVAAEGTSFENHGFYEASSPRKIGDTYYFVYSSVNTHELCYATAEKPLGPYTYGGVLVSNADIGFNGNTEYKMPYGNTHGGIVQVKGQWYVFYHRQTHGIECCRQACAQPLTLDENGHFAQAEITSCGLNGGPLTGLGTYNASYACHMAHETLGKERYTVRTCVRDTQPHIYEEKVDGTRENALHYIAKMQNGMVTGYKYFALGQATALTLCLRATQDGTMYVYLNEACTEIAASVPFTACDDWSTFTAPFAAPAATAPLYFRLETQGLVDWMEFTLEQ